MNYYIGLMLLVLLAGPACAQRVVWEQDVAADTARQAYGPNRTYYRHLVLGYAVALGSGPAGGRIQPFASGGLELSLRQKLRLSQRLALTADVGYRRVAYQLRQEEGKVVPDPVLHQREVLSWQLAQVAGHLRLNLDRRRGNALGDYLELGAWGGWAFSTSRSLRDAPSASVRVVKTVEQGLSYAARWQYGLGARVGSGRFAVVARKRLSTLWRGPAAPALPELPAWQMGLEVGWP